MKLPVGFGSLIAIVVVVVAIVLAIMRSSGAMAQLSPIMVLALIAALAVARLT